MLKYISVLLQVGIAYMGLALSDRRHCQVSNHILLICPSKSCHEGGGLEPPDFLIIHPFIGKGDSPEQVLRNRALQGIAFPGQQIDKSKMLLRFVLCHCLCVVWHTESSYIPSIAVECVESGTYYGAYLTAGSKRMQKIKS